MICGTISCFSEKNILIVHKRYMIPNSSSIHDQDLILQLVGTFRISKVQSQCLARKLGNTFVTILQKFYNTQIRKTDIQGC